MVPPAKEMLSLLLRPRQAARRVDSARLSNSNTNTPSPGPAGHDYGEQRHAIADFTEGDDDEEEEEDDDFDVDEGPSGPRINRPFQETNARRNSASLIPLFSTHYLGKLPTLLWQIHTIYNLSS